jgi:hypothetical protein
MDMRRRAPLLAGLLLSALARAQSTAVRLEIVADKLPFAPEELVDAVALRLGVAAQGERAAPRVRVRADGDGVLITVGECAPDEVCKERHVALGGLEGTAAARRVALAAIDLVRAEALPPARPPDVKPPRFELTALPALAAGSNLGAEPSLSAGARLAGAGTLGASWRLVRDLRLAIELGYSGGPAATVDGAAVSLHQLPARAGLGWRVAWPAVALEARLSAVVAGYWLVGAAARSGTLGGASAALWLTAPTGTRVRATVALGVDAFANRDRFTVHGQLALATERVAVWLGAGLSAVVLP